MIEIDLRFNRRTAHFTAEATYVVGKSVIRKASAAGGRRSLAIHRLISLLRKRGHGGKPYRVVEGEATMRGVIPKPKTRSEQL
jgi:hypothetical protein